MDGQLVSSDVYTPTPGYTNLGIDGSGSGIQVGFYTKQSDPNPYGQFRGLINIAGFYDKALDAAEHGALYNATKYRFT